MAKEQQPHWSDILKRRIANSKKGIVSKDYYVLANDS